MACRSFFSRTEPQGFFGDDPARRRPFLDDGPPHLDSAARSLSIEALPQPLLLPICFPVKLLIGIENRGRRETQPQRRAYAKGWHR